MAAANVAANVAATAAAACAEQYTGRAGALFAHALSAVMAAHCAHADALQWPPDDADDILSAGIAAYDFVIVGAGTAGSLLANRLGQITDWNILLVEAGDDPTFDSEVPAFLFSNQDTKQDWQHKTSKNPLYCRASADGACKWAKGKGMGGSTSINAMLYVRGNKADYQEWEALGNEGWGYDNVLEYFKKTENFSKINTDDNFNHYHSSNGELNIESFGGPQIPWKNVMAKAWQELGYKYNNDINGESQIGISNVPGSVKDGRRYNLAKRLLSDASKRGNLHIMKNTLVTKVLIDPATKITNGLDVRHKDGRDMQIKVTKEVILSAGAIKSPQILMLSGIGPRKHLEELKIHPLLDLPVGKNLQDHSICPIFIQMPEIMSTNLTKEEVVLFILQYMLTRDGPFRGIGMTDLLGFVNTQSNSDIPDIEFHHIYFSKQDDIILPAYRSSTGYVDEFWDIVDRINERNDLVGIYPTLLKPKSRGEILLKTSDAKDDPEVIAGYFIEEDDIETMLRGINFIFNLLSTPTFRSVDARVPYFNLKGCADTEIGSNEYWRCYTRHVASTIYHPVGTNKMAPLSESGVVNAELKVYGVQGLRVVDASIMPTLPRGNTMAPTLMVAEKGADMIKQLWIKKDKTEL